MQIFFSSWNEEMSDSGLLKTNTYDSQQQTAEHENMKYINTEARPSL